MLGVNDVVLIMNHKSILTFFNNLNSTTFFGKDFLSASFIEFHCHSIAFETNSCNSIGLNYGLGFQ